MYRVMFIPDLSFSIFVEPTIVLALMIISVRSVILLVLLFAAAFFFFDLNVMRWDSFAQTVISKTFIAISPLCYFTSRTVFCQFILLCPFVFVMNCPCFSIT